MEEVKQQTNEEIELKPIPIEQEQEQDMKQPEEEVEASGLVPLPIESTDTNLNPDENTAINDTTNVADDDNDTEMKDVSNETSNNEPSDEMIVEEEEEEEGGIIEEVIEEEEEESGDIVMPPPPPVNTDTTTTEANAAAPKPQPKTSSTQPNKEQDKDRARSHPITTDSTEGARYLNISLMKEWTNTEVLAWLTHRFGLWGQQYVPVFSNKKIDGTQLSALTEEDLKTSFGVTKPLHLVRMARDIRDASRPIHSIHKLIAPCYMDGGNAAAKMMRFGPKEVYAFSLRVPGLKMHAQTFLDRQINGRVLLECTDGQLVTAMKNEQITLLDAQGILEVMDQIKKEDSATDGDRTAIQIVYDVWTEMCRVNEIRFKLLPQHIRDYSKPAPTYYPPPQHRTYGQAAHGNAYATQRRHSEYGGGQYGGRMGGPEEERDGTPPLYEIKSVTEWGTEDCITWLGQIKESKVDLRVRYTPHFEQVKMTGPILLNMTPSTLSAICCITTKTHLKQLVKAIDKIRDHLVFHGFGQQAHVKDFTSKYGGGYNFPAIRYQRNNSAGYDTKRRNEQQERRQMYAQQQKQKRESMQQDTKMEGANGQHNEGQQDDASVAKCFVCGKTGNVMRCSQCKSAFYCSREHQVSDWARHSKECQK
eukprot:25580_1